MNQTRAITEGALMLAIFIALLLLSMFVPLAVLVFQLFLILPFLLYSVKYPVKYGVILLIAATFVTIIIGSIFIAPVALLYGTTGIVMGYCIRTEKGKLVTYIASSMVFLANIVLFYILAALFFEVNFIDELAEMILSAANQYEELLGAVGQTPNVDIKEQVLTMMSLMKSLAPSLLVSASFVAVIFMMLVNFPILQRLQTDVPRFAPFRLFKLPKSILWYYLITLILMVAAKPEEGTYLYLVVVNAAYILQILLIMQGLAFIFYYSHMKKWSKAIPIVATIAIFILPYFFSIVRLLGIIDLGFDLRQRLAEK